MPANEINAGGAAFTLRIKDLLSNRLDKINASVEGMGKRFQNIGERINSAGQRITAIGASAVGLGGSVAAGFGVAVNSAASFSETLSKFDTVFGDQANAVRSWAQTFGSEMGRSESQLLKFLSSAQDTFVPLGFDQQEAQAFSKQLTALALDLASFNDMSDQEAFDRLLSAVIGNTENLRAFGVVAQQAQIKAEALAQGFDPKNLTPYQKALAVMSLTMKGTTAAQGDLSRTSGSFTNKLKAFRAGLEDLSVKVGTALLPSLTKLLDIFSMGVSRVEMFVSQNQGLVVKVAATAAAIAGAGAALIALGVSVSGVGILISGIGAAVGALVTALGLVVSPIGLVVGGIVAIGAAIAKYSGAIDSFGASFGSLGEYAEKAIKRIQDAFSGGGLSAAWEQINAELQQVWSVSIAKMEIAWLKFRNFVARIAEEFSMIFSDAMSGAITAIASQISGLAQMLQIAGIDVPDYGKAAIDAASFARNVLTNRSEAAQARRTGEINALEKKLSELEKNIPKADFVLSQDGTLTLDPSKSGSQSRPPSDQTSNSEDDLFKRLSKSLSTTNSFVASNIQAFRPSFNVDQAILGAIKENTEKQEDVAKEETLGKIADNTRRIANSQFLFT